MKAARATLSAVLALLGFAALPAANGARGCDPHPWRPPFGLERVGALPAECPNQPPIEADAQAHPDSLINPVDLGAILPPHDWLLLAKGQKAIVNVAAVSRHRDIPNAQLLVRFADGNAVEVSLPLGKNQRETRQIELQQAITSDQSVLHVSLRDGNQELWKKDIRTLIVAEPPHWPAFGAVPTKLRYDASISIKDPKTGAYSTLPYEKGWDPKLNDVVVILPNGTRFVFWRGSSYVPFWAGLYNTGLTYEWAETTPPKGAYPDSVEPLMDKELRYGRVEILESTASRVHVRWTYQSTDFLYKVFGDAAAEDFYFYPDGFGTRVLTLTTAPRADYETTEFITMLPQSAYPLEVLPDRLIQMLFLDGQKQDVVFPYRAALTDQDLGILTVGNDPRPKVPRLYRIFQEKRDPATPIYFSPRDLPAVQLTFKPFYDQGEIVTPGYWGNHWPLGRGSTTGGAIDERIHLSPAHISTFCWGLWSQGNRPEPLMSSDIATLDALGHAREMITRRWAWLIGKTDASDAQLIQWAESFSAPPSLELSGAHLDSPSYSTERRAMRLIADSPSFKVRLRPGTYTVNPVFELENLGKAIPRVLLEGRALRTDEYAWDGATLWIKAVIDAKGATIQVQFPHSSIASSR